MSRSKCRNLLVLIAALSPMSATAAASLDQAGEDAAPILRSAKSGPWSAAATWEGGKVPGAGAKVLIREGHRIVYDVKSDEAIRGIHISGTLSFAPDRDTRLD